MEAKSNEQTVCSHPKEGNHSAAYVRRIMANRLRKVMVLLCLVLVRAWLDTGSSLVLPQIRMGRLQ